MRCEKCGVGGLIWANPFKTMPKEMICDKCKAAMSDIKRYDPVEIGWSGGEMRGSMKMVVDGDYVSYEDHIAAMETLKGVPSQDHEARIKALEENPPKYAKETFGSMGRHLNDLEKRTKALEKNSIPPSAIQDLVQMTDTRVRLMELERMMAEKTSILDHAFEVDKMLKKRLEALEQALNEHMEKERENRPLFERPGRITIQNRIDNKKDVVSMQDFDWALTIDPKTSPTGIPFEVALAYMKAGRKVRQPDFQNNAFLVLHGGYMRFSDGVRDYDVPLRYKNIMATDWMVIPEQQ